MLDELLVLVLVDAAFDISVVIVVNKLSVVVLVFVNDDSVVNMLDKLLVLELVDVENDLSVIIVVNELSIVLLVDVVVVNVLDELLILELEPYI